jgi:excisionase family DNA binding protein
MSVAEIAERLAVGEMAIYRMLDERIIPAVRVGKRWLVTRKAFEKWEENCGLPAIQERVKYCHVGSQAQVPQWPRRLVLRVLSRRIEPR